MSDERVHETLTQRLVSIIKQARGQVARTVNTAMVQAYWHLGREIVESEQVGQSRAEYGEALIRSVFEALQTQFGRGFGYSNVKRMKQFYVTYPKDSQVPVDEKSATVWRLLPSEQKGATVSCLANGAITVHFRSTLSWSHYRVLMKIEHTPSRACFLTASMAA